MKVDFHCHTKKIKTGDSESRNVDAKTFKEVLNDAEVKMVAITNHNSFDSKQYEEFVNEVNGDFLIFPGVELDVKDLDGKLCHAIVVADNNEVTKFDNAINSLAGIDNPNQFTLSIEDFVSLVNNLNCFVMVHIGKSRGFKDKSLDYLKENIKGNHRLLYETSSLRRAGIITNKNEKSLIGSDVSDWSQYPKDKLPDLRFKIDSFDRLMHFFKKDPIVVESLLNTVKNYQIDVSYKDKQNPNPPQKEEIQIYEGINVIFGAKATGKTECLNAIGDKLESDKYQLKVSRYPVEDSAKKQIDDRLKISDDDRKNLLASYHKDNLEEDFDKVRVWTESSPTKLSDYYEAEKDKAERNNRSNIAIALISEKLPTDLKKVEAERNNYKKINEIISTIDNIRPETYLNDIERDTLNQSLNLLKQRISDKYCTEFVSYQSNIFANNCVKDFQTLIEIAENIKLVPNTCGFLDYAENILSLQLTLSKINDGFKKESSSSTQFLGTIDSNKDIGIRTTISMFNENSEGYKKDNLGEAPSTVKGWKATILAISKNIYNRSKLIDCHTKYKEIYQNGQKLNLNNFTCIKKVFYTNESANYSPSNGESTMLALEEALDPYKFDAYILDEPETNLSNNYVNDVLLPKLIKLERQKKIIVLVTHNANLAVRTTPYTSILKTHDDSIYKTYVGCPFLKNLTNVLDKNDTVDWQDQSITILEGGQDAFDERGEIYYAK